MSKLYLTPISKPKQDFQMKKLEQNQGQERNKKVGPVIAVGNPKLSET